MKGSGRISFGIIGGGAWGTAFAKLVKGNGSGALIWNRDSNESEVPSIEDLKKCDVIVVALPFQVLREFLTKHTAVLSTVRFLLLSKGIEIGTMFLGHQIFAEVLPDAEFNVLSGPNFASEIIQGLPAATVIAGKNAEFIKGSVVGNAIRVYTSKDVVGVEVCGAIKNVIAIASGITIGAGYGENAKAALICRSLVEIEHLVKSMGGVSDTVFGLSGIGDLILTCGSPTSRNFAFGFEVGKAGALGEKIVQNTKTIEGIHTTLAIHKLIESKNLDMPICSEIYQILFKQKPVSESLSSLMSRIG